jgi:hypothetical protein
MFSHPIENQLVMRLIHVMLGIGINTVLFFSFHSVIHRKARNWRADCILQANPHENRALNPRSHIHGIKVT